MPRSWILFLYDTVLFLLTLIPILVLVLVLVLELVLRLLGLANDELVISGDNIFTNIYPLALLNIRMVS